MGLSFHDEPSLVETASSLRFVTDEVNSGNEKVRTEDCGQERSDDDIGGSDNIWMVDIEPIEPKDSPHQ